MIHAWNFIRGISEENGGHGQNFLAKMHEINRLAGTNISVYHTFHDEVDLYKTHWWRCDGVCQNRSPYYGFVKRTCNRTPGPNDLWWKQHEQTCGGKFIKVKEPEKKRKGKENDGKAAKPKTTKAPSGSTDIRQFFTPTAGDDATVPKKSMKSVDIDTPSSTASGGHPLGGTASGHSRLLDIFDDQKKVPKKRKLYDDTASVPPPIVIDGNSTPPSREHKSYHVSIKSELGDDDIILIDDEFDDNFVSAIPKPSIPKPITEPNDGKCHCPICNMSMRLEEVNDHLDLCLFSV